MLVNNIRRNPFLLAPTLVACVLALMGIVSMLPIKALGQTASHFLIAVIMLLVFGVPCFFFFVWRGNVIGRFGVRPITADGWHLALSASAVLILLNLLFQAVFFADTYDYRVYTLYGSTLSSETKSIGSFLLTLFVFVIIPAVTQGILFRGIMLYEYRHTGPLVSILLSAFLGGLTALSFSSFPIEFLNGLILAAVTFLTGNFLISLLSNVVWLLFAVFAEKYFIFIAREAETSMLFFIVFGLLFLLSLLWFFRSAEYLLRERGQAEEDIPKHMPVRKRGLILYDVFSAPMVWGSVFCFLLFAVLHLFL